MKIVKNRLGRIIDENHSLRIKPVFNDFHNLIMKGYHEYPKHCHGNYEVILIKKGPYLCTLNRAELAIDTNHFLLIKPGDWHQDHLYDGQSHYVLHFSIDLKDSINSTTLNLLKPGVSPQNQIFKISDYWKPLSFFKSMEDNSEVKDLYSINIQESLMELFFWNMVRCIPEELLSDSFNRISRKHLFHDRLFNLFQTSFTENLAVDRMCHELGMSRRNLSYYCKKYYDDSPAKLFNRFKLNKAVELLSLDSLSIKEISSYLGYENQFHFSRTFKRFYGVAPSIYSKEPGNTP